VYIILPRTDHLSLIWAQPSVTSRCLHTYRWTLPLHCVTIGIVTYVQRQVSASTV